MSDAERCKVVAIIKHKCRVCGVIVEEEADVEKALEEQAQLIEKAKELLKKRNIDKIVLYTKIRFKNGDMLYLKGIDRDINNIKLDFESIEEIKIGSLD